MFQKIIFIENEIPLVFQNSIVFLKDKEIGSYS